MPVIPDPRYRGGLIGGTLQLPPDAPEELDPSLLDTLAAASRQSTLVGAAYERVTNPDPDDVDPIPEGFDALDHITGYEDFADSFIGAETPGEVTGIKRRIDGERQDRDTLRRAGLGGPVAEIGLNLLDPTFLVAIAVPELAIAKAGRIGRVAQTAFEGATVASAYEGGQQLLQETRTGTESAFTIGGGALLGGILGSLSRRVPQAELAPIREAIRSEVGAAAVRPATTLERESLAAGGRQYAKVVGKVPLTETDLQLVMRSESIAARETLQELAEVVPVLEKNVAGDATPTSVESLLFRHEGRVADFVVELKRAWRTYRSRELPPGEQRLPRDEFDRAVAYAARRGDRDMLPEVEQAASFLRTRVFDPLKTQAQKLKLLPPDAEIDLFAQSYFMRQYSRHAIRARRPEWDALLTEHFQAKGIERAEARSLAEEITRRILGTDRGLANFNIRTPVKDAGPLFERVLDIRDELIEPFLVSDPVRVASAYVREMAPQIEITKRFGDKDMSDAFQRVRDEYGILRTRAASEFGKDPTARLNALQIEERDVVDALFRVRDRLYGRAGMLGPDTSQGQRVAVDILRGWRNLVAAAKLGTAAITGGSQDLTRIVAQFGFLPTMSRLAKLATSKEFRQLSKANARRLGVAAEVALARRVQIAADGAITEGWTQLLAETTYKLSGLNHVTDLWRTLSATLIEDKILAAATAVASKHSLAAGLRTQLASLGLDADMLRRVATQARQHGENLEGIRVSRSMFWTDSRAADAYDAAIVKSARTTVMQPGAADRVWWADSEIGRTLGQIKSFALAAPMRLAITPMQLIGQRRFAEAARFTGTMMVGGYLAHALRQLAAGREPVTDPVGAAGEAFAESGMAGILPDIVSPFARRFGILGESARYADRNVTSAFGGPAVGSFVDLYDVVYNRTSKGLSAADLQAVRRLLPLQNLWWMRRAINATVGETAEALELKGATPLSFGARVVETKPLAGTVERGGTGTGQLVQ
ncbi:MAG: hypothetical protein WD944_06510 [Steroidobacteraceae bacterium]